MKRVVVTGIGLVCPLGIGKTDVWKNLLAGAKGLKTISHFDPDGFPSTIAGQVPDYKIGEYIPKSYRKFAKVMARDIELAVIAANDAMVDAGLKTRAYVEKSEINSLRFGCNIGAALITAELNELTSAMTTARHADQINKLDIGKWGGEGMQQLTPLWLLKYLPNMLACHVTIIHGLMGPSNTITCDASSSHLAIGEAFRTLQRGKADLAICGGAESRINPMGMVRQQLLGRLNTSYNNNPAGAVRPFDKQAAGTIYGEGGGLLILEELEHARARGAKIYAEMVGFGASQDTFDIVEPDPSGYCYARAITSALRDAGESKEDVDLIVPCGMGIEKSDRAELAGLRSVFGEALSVPAFSPIKAQTGLLGAGAGVDVASAVLSISTGQVPPAVNTLDVVDGTKLNVSTEVRSQNTRLAVTSTYAMGGQNAAIVFKAVE